MTNSSDLLAGSPWPLVLAQREGRVTTSAEEEGEGGREGEVVRVCVRLVAYPVFAGCHACR